MADDETGSGPVPVALMTVVAAALVDPAGRVLLQRRLPGKQLADLWEFPGGKIEPGETPEAALVRELAEELAIGVDPRAMVPLAFASAPAGSRHLLLLLYVIRDWAGVPQPLEASALAWVAPGDMRALAMPPADVPLVAMLERLFADPGRHPVDKAVDARAETDHLPPSASRPDGGVVT